MDKKGIIYYTDNRLGEPIFSAVQQQLLKSGLPIVSVSLAPITFGRNIVRVGEPGYISMVDQIVTALEASGADYVFFCEHDVLYHPSHFDFTPAKDDVYYYNMNNWRWAYPGNKIIRYDGLTSLSQLCVRTTLALQHFKTRQERMYAIGLEKFRTKDPHHARVWGYEPGRKTGGNGEWYSPSPNIDIRHATTFTLRKVGLKDFRTKPTGWKETTLDNIPGWDVQSLFTYGRP
ncbi:hypothetical protein A3A64_00790 [Candidatus Gottesmanbacteria bacterium RIFCSPLOWO2_01_FULL_48_11]|uniref:Glycosyltransferase n=2 Tax=Candidatus Gottesmaniibacteriota TaxID=1752720 RepID=A0A0G1X111_9BACT|nr:MAG: hypothetical protein UY16_C0013G0010 [Candidatus Gottesmanbacteria bacterium GW2011_GWA2_47_9]OGG28485.1 MAG: hypothetical protein A3A64_00790 [Candidatus Gottesmanbacteria bacterium RIFCSPLOWO2_01_FULL_48_11]